MDEEAQQMPETANIIDDEKTTSIITIRKEKYAITQMVNLGMTPLKNMCGKTLKKDQLMNSNTPEIE